MLGIGSFLFLACWESHSVSFDNPIIFNLNLFC